VLAAVGLAGERGGRPLFRDLHFQLQPGQVVWLRGRNGRGKTSLLRLMAGLSTPAQGAVHCAGVPLPQAGAAWRERLLFIAHANALKEDLTVAEALRFLAQVQGRDCSAAQLQAALARLGVGALARRPVRTLSQGQRRRVSLARLALPQPASVWLLDEPFDALDDDGVRCLNGLLSEHAAAGGSTLLTSHQAVQLADPVPTVLDLDAVAATRAVVPEPSLHPPDPEVDAADREGRDGHLSRMRRGLRHDPAA
jgi:heme exporter protein A